jgi:catechol 2,3-dioxygenase-like lactoylglutathione lyase family enzyme
MPYKLSRCVCLCTPRHEQAVDFYQKTLGLKQAGRTDSSVEFEAPPFRLFVDSSDSHGGTALGMVFEIIVPNLEAAREELLAAGCQVVRWQG